MRNQTDERRQYARHPIQVPLAVWPKDGTERFVSRIGDLSEGGLSFTSPNPMTKGTGVEIEFPVYDRRFTLKGAVTSCTEVTDATSYRVGLAFTSTGMSFKMKLAEQVLRINQLRRDLTRQRGTDVTIEEAGEHWVEQYA